MSYFISVRFDELKCSFKWRTGTCAILPNSNRNHHVSRPMHQYIGMYPCWSHLSLGTRHYFMGKSKTSLNEWSTLWINPLNTYRVGFSATRSSNGSSQSSLHSQWLSKNVKTSAMAASAPRTRDRTKPSRFSFRMTRTLFILANSNPSSAVNGRMKERAWSKLNFEYEVCVCPMSSMRYCQYWTLFNGDNQIVRISFFLHNLSMKYGIYDSNCSSNRK